MKDGVRIVNAARGELIDETALVDALRSGKVAGAALDVFSQEPYSGPLLGLENVVTTPHLAASTEEAQDRAGIIVAEQVAAALEGGIIANAVNVPAPPAEELEQLKPFLPLASKLGALAAALAGGNPSRIELTYHGRLAERDTRLLTVAALNGIFQDRVEQPVNYVNAPLVALERGVEVSEERRRPAQDFTSLISVKALAGDEAVTVAGTTTGPEQQARLVRALDYKIEVELEPLMLFVLSEDRPGTIGRLGTALGEAGVNIANMAFARTRPSDRALMALTLDNPLPDGLVERLAEEPGFLSVRAIVLPSA